MNFKKPKKIYIYLKYIFYKLSLKFICTFHLKIKISIKKNTKNQIIKENECNNRKTQSNENYF